MIRALDIFYAAKLRELREECNLKQFAAAQLLGIDQQHYSELESGKKNFTSQMVANIYNSFLVQKNTESLSLSRDWFKSHIFEKLSEPKNEGNIHHFILLYYKRESLIVQIKDVENVLRAQWNSLSGENNYRNSDSMIKIGYLNKKED